MDLLDVIYRSCENLQQKLNASSIQFIKCFFFNLAIKCNTDPVVLELMANLGIGFDCASKVWSKCPVFCCCYLA